MRPPVLTLIHDLADAIALGDAELTFTRTAELAELLGLEGAVAVARALALDAGHVITVPPRLVVQLAPGLARCA